MWIRLSGNRMEIAAPCGCLQAFFVTPEFEIERSALASRCGKTSCEYNYVDLLAVGCRVTTCMRQAKQDPFPLATVSAASGDLRG